MYSTFLNAFHQDEPDYLTSVEVPPRSGRAEVDLLLRQLGGKSFNEGMYRVVSTSSVERWNQRVAAVFPSYSSRLVCFGIDWLGRAFALDPLLQIEGSSSVLLLEPGTGEVLEIPVNLHQFHEVEIVQYREEVLAESFYKNWRATGAAAPRFNECIGYKRPLFLGGSDVVENLEVAKLEVYWELAAQLLNKTRGLPIGTPIDEIFIRLRPLSFCSDDCFGEKRAAALGPKPLLADRLQSATTGRSPRQAKFGHNSTSSFGSTE